MPESKPKLDVLCVGDSMVDMTTYAPALPPRGGNVWSTAPEVSPGGTVANVAADLATLGMRSGFAGVLSVDPYGEYFLETMVAAGVDVSDVVRDEQAFTGVVLAIVDDESGERTFIACARGSAYAHLTAENIEGMDFARAQAVHFSGVCFVEEPSRSAVLHGLARAKSHAIPIYYDPNLRLQGDVFPEDLKAAQMTALQVADVVLVGNEELEQLFGSLDDPSQVFAFLGEEARLLIVKRGEHGADAYTRDRHLSMPAFHVEVVDTTGAGDAFNAGFMAAELRGMGLEQAMTYACAVAGIKVSRSGARSVPSHEETVAFLQRHGMDVG